MGLTKQIKEQARRMGFDLVGVTSPAPSAHLAFYTDYLARGYHGEMAYLARPNGVKKRANPRRLMPEIRSIVAVGMNYYTGKSPPTKGLRGRVACYAWGADYHAVLTERLHQLAAWIAEQVGQPVAHRVYVDTGPLLERELAQRAGLGWIGKNTCQRNSARRWAIGSSVATCASKTVQKQLVLVRFVLDLNPHDERCQSSQAATDEE